MTKSRAEIHKRSDVRSECYRMWTNLRITPRRLSGVCRSSYRWRIRDIPPDLMAARRIFLVNQRCELSAEVVPTIVKTS